MSEYVDIGGLILNAEKVVEVEHSADVMKHPVEEGFKVSDHLLIRPQKVRIDAILFGSDRYNDYNNLKDKMNAGKPFDFLSSMGSVSNCVLTRISPRQEDSENCLSCTLELQEIKRATTSITTITPIKDPITDITINASVSGSEATQTPGMEPRLTARTVDDPAEGESWVDSIQDGITSTAGAISDKLFGWL